MTVDPLEVAANAVNTISIFLAARNSVHTWWTGIAGCALFGWLFMGSRLYADATLQGFFIAASAAGWWRWIRGIRGAPLPVRRSPPGHIVLLAAAGVAVTLGYGWLLRRFTNAWAPYPDSAVLAFSVLGQLLLVGRRIESWWCWLLVNTIAVPLYISRDLHLTAALYGAYWVNAVVALVRWRRLVAA